MEHAIGGIRARKNAPQVLAALMVLLALFGTFLCENKKLETLPDYGFTCKAKCPECIMHNECNLGPGHEGIEHRCSAKHRW